MHLQRQIKLFFCALSFLIVTGCNLSIWNHYPAPLPTKAGLVSGAVAGAAIGGVAAGGLGIGLGTVMGGVVGASFGNIIQAHMTLVDKLQYHGVQVIQLGDEIKLILPTDRFFQPNSPLMNREYFPVMDQVCEFIEKFQKITVKVSGYTDSQGAWQRNLALSISQAQSVMQYLWNYGIDARLVFAEGYGELYPIANNNSARGRILNRRIEITLRRIRDANDP